MTKSQLRKRIHDHFKARSAYERLWCDQHVLPLVEELLGEIKK